MSVCISAGAAERELVRDGRAFEGFATVERLAVEMSQKPFKPSRPLPPASAELDYDDYRFIAFRHEQSVQLNPRSPFRLEFYHRGYLFADEVAVERVDDGAARPIDFDRRMFDYRGRLAKLSVPDDLGFAGFRVAGRYPQSAEMLELASFLGASYFRSAGQGQVFGTSARGLAVDIGLPRSEEFPAFRRFWVDRPGDDEKAVTIWALLDSPSVVGAYEFVFTPDRTSRFDVSAVVFARRPVEKIGVAPLTSMWSWGDGRAGPRSDPRPKVHDSDGLLMHTADGEWVWRALGRQDYPSLSRYDLAGLRGFGLMQRDRRPENYRDDEAKYHLRPNVWIEPRDGWSQGRIELLELPAEHEGIDNIAAWWTPNEPLEPGRPLRLNYTISFASVEPSAHRLARATALRIHRGGKALQIEVDFAGGDFKSSPTPQAVAPLVTAIRGQVRNVRCEPVGDGAMRLLFDLEPESKQPVELSAVLRRGDRAVTETWRYLCRP